MIDVTISKRPAWLREVANTADSIVAECASAGITDLEDVGLFLACVGDRLVHACNLGSGNTGMPDIDDCWDSTVAAAFEAFFDDPEGRRLIATLRPRSGPAHDSVQAHLCSERVLHTFLELRMTGMSPREILDFLSWIQTALIMAQITFEDPGKLRNPTR